MELKKEDIFKQYKWLKRKKAKFIISADYDGLICASFLSHFLNWKLVGYYNMENIWISSEGIKNRNNIIWVDLNILAHNGKSIGGHITMLNGDSVPDGFITSCNPNNILKINNKQFNRKYPFSTLVFLLWLFDYQVPHNEYAKFLILHSDNIWMKLQNYKSNVINWTKLFSNFNWNKLFESIDSIDFEKKIDQIYYPKLIKLNAVSGFSKLKSKHLKIRSRELKFNPDWDEDIILKLFDLFASYLKWTPPELPKIIKKVNGKKTSVKLSSINTNFLDFLNDNKVFSYAITSPNVLKYTNFNKIK